MTIPLASRLTAADIEDEAGRNTPQAVSADGDHPCDQGLRSANAGGVRPMVIEDAPAR
jgi:hypothetical protein